MACFVFLLGLECMRLQSVILESTAWLVSKAYIKDYDVKVQESGDFSPAQPRS